MPQNDPDIDNAWVSLEWLVTRYEGVGVTFTDIVAFEATQMGAEDFFNAFPADLVAKTRFYNVPVASEVPLWPLFPWCCPVVLTACVLLRGCVAVWLCGCVAVWLCGCVAVWLWLWLWLCDTMCSLAIASTHGRICATLQPQATSSPSSWTLTRRSWRTRLWLSCWRTKRCWGWWMRCSTNTMLRWTDQTDRGAHAMANTPSQTRTACSRRWVMCALLSHPLPSVPLLTCGGVVFCQMRKHGVRMHSWP